MNIETAETIEGYEYQKRRLERKRASTCREKRDRITAQLRDRGQPLFRITLVVDRTTWNCFADRDAIRTLKEDGYKVRMKAERFRDIEKARPGTNQRTISFTDSNCIPDEKEGQEPEPWLLVSLFEIHPRLRELYNE